MQDFQSQLYESYYLNFISAISRQKLEDIALAAIQSNVVTQVSKVWFTRHLNGFRIFALLLKSYVAVHLILVTCLGDNTVILRLLCEVDFEMNNMMTEVILSYSDLVSDERKNLTLVGHSRYGFIRTHRIIRVLCNKW